MTSIIKRRQEQKILEKKEKDACKTCKYPSKVICVDCGKKLCFCQFDNEGFVVTFVFQGYISTHLGKHCTSCYNK